MLVLSAELITLLDTCSSTEWKEFIQTSRTKEKLSGVGNSADKTPLPRFLFVDPAPAL